MHLRLFLLCLALLCSVSAIQAQDINVAKEFEEANRLMEEQLWNIALPIWRKLAVAEPQNANFQYNGYASLENNRLAARIFDSLNVTASYHFYSNISRLFRVMDIKQINLPF